MSRDELASLVAIAAIQAAVFFRTGQFIMEILVEHMPRLL